MPEQLPEHLLSRIAHKHASLGITPAQYDVVHDNLFWAIVDVLGDAVTPEVAAAWDEVYWLMAYALINQERGLYSARGVRPETVWREWEVAEKIQETADVVTFRVRRTDDRLVQDLAARPVRDRAGAHARRRAPAPAVQPDQGRRRRAPPVLGQAGARRRQARRRGVQPAVRHGAGRRPADDVAALRRRRPRRLGRPVVFASAGIGITPMAGMLSHLAAAGSHLPITLLHADVDEASFALRRQVLDDIRCAARRLGARLVRARRARARLPVDGVHAGLMDLDDVKLPGRRRLLPLRAAAVHAGGPQRADRPGRARRATSSTRCSAPTSGRPTSSPRRRPGAGRHAAA